MYVCDNKLLTEHLAQLMESGDDKFGLVIMDGSGTLFGTQAGNQREVLQKFSVEWPKKHGRGGLSALRFARLRLEKRHNYVRKVGEIANQFFIPSGDVNSISLGKNKMGLLTAGLKEIYKGSLEAGSDIFETNLFNRTFFHWGDHGIVSFGDVVGRRSSTSSC